MYSQESNQIASIRCPYVKEHLMPPERFLVHLKKCQYPYKEDFQTCKFNPLHVILLPEIAKHEAGCPDRQKHTKYTDDNWQSTSNIMDFNALEDDYSQKNPSALSSFTQTLDSSKTVTKPKNKIKISSFNDDEDEWLE